MYFAAAATADQMGSLFAKKNNQSKNTYENLQ